MTVYAGIIAGWRRACAKHGVRVRPPAPILNPDPTLLVVNAGITPFKPMMLAGEPLDPVAIVQPCLRTHWSGSGRFAFEMLTLFGEQRDVALGVGLTMDFLADIGAEGSSLSVVADDAVPEVFSLACSMVGPDRVTRQSGNTDDYWTQWEFGHGDLLSGRGLTLVYTDEAGRRASLGNVILVHHKTSGRVYFDIGFGVERLGSVVGEGDEWDGEANYVANVEAMGFGTDEAREIVNHLIAARRLIEAGALPGSRGAGYLLRKLVRRAVDIAVEAAPQTRRPEDAASSLLEARWFFAPDAPDHRVSSLIADISGAYLSSVARAMRAVKKDIRNGADEAVMSRLHDTYGLPRWAVARLLRA